VGKILRMSRVASQDFLFLSEVGAVHISDNSCSPPRSCLSAGLPAARLVSKIGSLVQQAYLDAHRAKVEISSRYGLALSFIEGKDDTLLICSSEPVNKWFARMPNGTVICRALLKEFQEFHKVLGTYSTRIAMRIPLGLRRSVVRRGVAFVVNYYQISTTEVEIESVVEMILVEPESICMKAPTGSGASSRLYRWLTKVVAQHWKRLPSLVGHLNSRYPVNTVVECCLFGNFLPIPSVLECNKHR
jgi:hypothetical protein